MLRNLQLMNNMNNWQVLFDRHTDPFQGADHHGYVATQLSHLSHRRPEQNIDIITQHCVYESFFYQTVHKPFRERLDSVALLVCLHWFSVDTAMTYLHYTLITSEVHTCTLPSFTMHPLLLM